MALVVADRVQQTTTTAGTGTVTLSGSVAGYQSFSVIGNGNTTYYTLVDGNNWEVGTGTYTASGTTLSRDTVYASSAGGTTKITLSGGTTLVFVTYPAEIATMLGNTSTGSGSVVLANTPTLTTPNIGAATGTSLSLSTPLGISSGGTNSSATPTAGGVGYGTGTAHAYTSAGTAGYYLQSTGSTAPTWATVTSSTGSPAYYGLFICSTNQPASGSPTANTANQVLLDATPVLNNGITTSSNNVVIANAGYYFISTELAVVSSSGGAPSVSVWLAQNGTNVANSAQDITLTGGANNPQMVICNWIINAAAGDSIAVYWSSPSASVTLPYQGTLTSPTRPASPSAIVAVHSLPQIGIGYAGLTSTTSQSLTTGSKTFTVNTPSTSSAFTVGTRVRAAYTTTPADYLEGVITAYSSTSLTVNVDTVGGSGGPYASWNFSVAGNYGTVGGSNTQVQYNNSGALGGISGATTDGTALTVSSGNLKLSGATSGTAILNAPGTGGGTLTLPAGTTTLAGLGTAQTFTAAQTIQSTSANALTVGANGTTNPQLNVDDSTASVATGLNIKGAAAASGLALSVISSGTNENLTVDAKGSGSITLGSVSTGGLILGAATGGSKGTGTINAQGYYLNGVSVGSVYTKTTFSATAGQTSFTVTYTVGLVDVYLNGVKLTTSDYTASSGTAVVLAVAASLNDIVEIIAWTSWGATNTNIGVGTGTSLTLTGNSANELTAGPNGTTNPTFNVDASTASVATGLNVKGAAAAGGLALSVLSSGTNENLTIDAKGTGTITLNGTATGTVSVNTKLGIGMTPSNILDITQNQNAISTISILNNSTGTVAGALLQLTNGTNSLQIAQYGTGFTTSGYNVQDGALYLARGNGGSSFINLAAAPMRFGINNAEVARFDSSGNLLVGTTSQNNKAKLTVSGRISATSSFGNFVLYGFSASAGTATTIATLPISVTNLKSAVKIKLSATNNDSNAGYAGVYEEWNIIYGSYGGGYQTPQSTNTVRTQYSVNSGVINISTTVAATIASNTLTITCTVNSGGSTGVSTAYCYGDIQLVGTDYNFSWN